MISSKNLLRSLSYRVQKKQNMTWHSFSSSFAWHKEQILTCSRVLGTVYLPVSMRSRWFPRQNLLIADIWSGFFIASRNSVLLVSVLKLKVFIYLLFNFLFEARFKSWWLIKALDRFWATLEMRVLPLFSFKIMEHELYSSHNVLIFCDMPGWFFSSISLESCKQCFAISSSGRFCKWIQYFKILISMDNFKDSFPSSFLAATLGHCWSLFVSS